jgi:hypothetical protein
MSKKEDALRYAWGAITLTAEDLARAIGTADEDARQPLEEVFELVATAQQMAESLYLAHATRPELASRDADTVYLAIPRDLEREIRDAIAILTASAKAENTFEAASEEIKSLLALCNRGRSLGVGAYAVIDRLSERAQRLRELSKNAQGVRQIDMISGEELDRIRTEIRFEFESKLLAASAKLQELRDMVRARRAEQE